MALAAAGLAVPATIGLAGEQAGPDDVLDASGNRLDRGAMRCGNGSVTTLHPENLGNGRQAVFWA